eukprot:15452114-Alexandrium_andersonii.AAC.2
MSIPICRKSARNLGVCAPRRRCTTAACWVPPGGLGAGWAWVRSSSLQLHRGGAGGPGWRLLIWRARGVRLDVAPRAGADFTDVWSGHRCHTTMSYLLCDRHTRVDMYWRQSSADCSGVEGTRGRRSPSGGCWHWGSGRAAWWAPRPLRCYGLGEMVRSWGSLPFVVTCRTATILSAGSGT